MLVPPGDYSVMFELLGFGSVKHEGIRVALGFTATVNGELGVASLQENVTVTGASPVVDTVWLARRLLEGRQKRVGLASLAYFFGTATRPCHRALAGQLGTTSCAAPGRSTS